jgi:hypothetical protein
MFKRKPMGSSMKRFMFDKLIAIRPHSEWVAIDNASDASRLLHDEWPVRNGPCYRRAVANCDAYLAGEAPMMAARASIVVAAMEAEMLVELHEDQMSFVEAQVALVAEQSVRGSGMRDSH